MRVRWLIITISAFLIYTSTLIVLPRRAHCELSGNEDVWERVENASRARQFYMVGEAAYKAGDLENAAACWLKALELKPDSEYTQQCLTRAQKQLFEKYQKMTVRQLDQKDRVSAYLSLQSLRAYLPKDATLSAKLEEIKNQLSENENKAIDAYFEAVEYFYKRNYPQARESIQKARGLAGISATVEEAVDTIQKAYDANQYTFEALPEDLFTTREVAFENYYWKHERTVTVSAPSPDRTATDSSVMVYTLHGRLRNITREKLSNVTIRAEILDNRTKRTIGSVTGLVESMDPSGRSEVDFVKPTGATLDVLTTVSASASSKNLKTQVRITKKTKVAEQDMVVGFASEDDREDIGKCYTIKAYAITTERAGTGKTTEQEKPSGLWRKQY